MRTVHALAVFGLSAALLVGGIGRQYLLPVTAQAHPTITMHSEALTRAATLAWHAAGTVQPTTVRAEQTSDATDTDAVDVQQGDQSAPDNQAGVTDSADSSDGEASSAVDGDTIQVEQ